MSDAPANPNPFRLSPGDAFGFSDDGERVPVTWPNHAESVEDYDDARENALHWLRVGLLVALEGGRVDGIASRTAALAVVAGLFDSPAAAADKVGLDRRAVARAFENIRVEINSQAETSKPIANTGNFPPA
jgi:hypothetical protein